VFIHPNTGPAILEDHRDRAVCGRANRCHWCSTSSTKKGSRLVFAFLPLAKKLAEKLKARKEDGRRLRIIAGGLISAVLLAVPGGLGLLHGRRRGPIRGRRRAFLTATKEKARGHSFLLSNRGPRWQPDWCVKAA